MIHRLEVDSLNSVPQCLRDKNISLTLFRFATADLWVKIVASWSSERTGISMKIHGSRPVYRVTTCIGNRLGASIGICDLDKSREDWYMRRRMGRGNGNSVKQGSQLKLTIVKRFRDYLWSREMINWIIFHFLLTEMVLRASMLRIKGTVKLEVIIYLMWK